MKKFAMFLLVLGLLPGCRHDDNKNDAAGDLVGMWMSVCEQADVVGQYSKFERKFEQGSYTYTEHIYSDSNCTTMMGMVVTSSGTYKASGSVTTSNGNKATEIDITTVGGETELNIYAIIDSKLYFGDDDGNAATRPTALDFSYYFVKL